jgi:TonB family protein
MRLCEFCQYELPDAVAECPACGRLLVDPTTKESLYAEVVRRLERLLHGRSLRVTAPPFKGGKPEPSDQAPPETSPKLQENAKGTPVSEPSAQAASSENVLPSAGKERKEKLASGLMVPLDWIRTHKKGVGETLVALVAAGTIVGFLWNANWRHHPLGKNNPPVLTSCGADKTRVKKGERIKLTAVAHDPDGDRLKYEWHSDFGDFIYNQDDHEIVKLDTSEIPVSSGDMPIHVSLNVSDEQYNILGGPITIMVEPIIISNNKDDKGSENKNSGKAPVKRTIRDAHARNDTEPYRHAMQLFRATEYEKAMEVIDEGLKRYPGDPDLQRLKQNIVNTVSDLNERNNPPATPRPEKPAPPAPDRRTAPAIVGYEPPMIKRRVEPDYPTEARQAEIYGDVIVEVDIDEEGTITHAKAVSGPYQLRQAAVDAARKSKFDPARSNGRPVSEKTRILYRFKPQP